MSRSLGDVVLSFSPLQVAEYLVEKGHLQPLTNPVSQALQAHSLDLSLPVTSFCYKDSEKKSRKVHTVRCSMHVLQCLQCMHVLYISIKVIAICSAKREGMHSLICVHIRIISGFVFFQLQNVHKMDITH